jgi:hypothetical protein
MNFFTKSITKVQKNHTTNRRFFVRVAGDFFGAKEFLSNDKGREFTARCEEDSVCMIFAEN